MLLSLLSAALLLLIADSGTIAEDMLPDLPYGNEICVYRADPGRCNGLFKKYFYNISTLKCEEFIYGGCGGNENNFETKKKCLAKCKAKDQRNPCDLESISGPCRGYFRRYFYNKHAKKCELFIYGGCLGNRNNFRSEEHCLKICQKKVYQNICMAPADKGNCYKRITRHFYNNSSLLCETFTYSGCGGNQNNFKNKKQCKRTCRKGTRHHNP
ncbi:tissue factor pathway inhibitor [Amblyraja radiata]|uniref:tissue factor pathway inhibitor n=1 Tax=Amblyraja radiata TaxID=386614 RepID=UPI00140311CE|nr:tissue factor pathway inhibitor [Amblyraja radiata]